MKPEQPVRQSLSASGPPGVRRGGPPAATGVLPAGQATRCPAVTAQPGLIASGLSGPGTAHGGPGTAHGGPGPGLPFNVIGAQPETSLVCLACHLDPCHRDIECRTFDIERTIRYRRLRYPMPIRYRRFAPSISYVDIEGVRYPMHHHAISKVTNLRYRRSLIVLSISMFHIFDIEHKLVDIVCRYRIRYRRPFSRSISKVMS